MTKKKRLIILLIYAVLFFAITPYIVLYSLGYRIDVASKRIIATGGIYVKALPQGTDIIIDSKIKNKTGLFSNTVFVQNLLPKQHAVLIQKEGYHDYQKNLLVRENQVTKLENVVLFKQKMLFDLLEGNTDYFSTAKDNNTLLVANIETNAINFALINLTSKVKQDFFLSNEILTKAGLSLKNTKLHPDNWIIQWSNDSNKALLTIEKSYFLLDFSLREPTITNLAFLANSEEPSFEAQNSDYFFFIKEKNLYSSKQKLPLIKNVVTYQAANRNITWLSLDGFLYVSDSNGRVVNKVTKQIFPIKKISSYKIIHTAGLLFLQENEYLYLLNQNLGVFESFYNQVEDVKISPDGQKMIYFNQYEILYYLLNPLRDEQSKGLLLKTTQQINDLYWLNSDYIIFKSENISKPGQNNITIAEIDNRGDVNTINIPQVVSLLSGEHVDVNQPKIFFNHQEKKLYILTNNQILVSEKLIP